jgi:hypothetical protein
MDQDAASFIRWALDQRTFIARLNIEHYRQKLLTEQDETTRERIVQLLAEEEARLAAPSDPPRKSNVLSRLQIPAS